MQQTIEAGDLTFPVSVATSVSACTSSFWVFSYTQEEKRSTMIQRVD